MKGGEAMSNNEIRFKFNEKKTTQAVALFLEKNGGKMNYMKLIKLLYLADRGALTHWERPITGDAYVSMPRGPVLSTVLDIINNENYPNIRPYWFKYISTPKDHEINLEEMPELDALSKREIELIDELYEEFKDFNQWEMVDLCHEILPEWEEVKDTSKPIEIETILRTLEKTDDEIEMIDEEVSNLNHIEKILSIND